MAGRKGGTEQNGKPGNGGNDMGAKIEKNWREGEAVELKLVKKRRSDQQVQMVEQKEGREGDGK